MERKQEHQVPVEVIQDAALTLDDLIEGWHKAGIVLPQLLQLKANVLPEVSDCSDIVVDLVVLAGYQKRRDLVLNHKAGQHELFSEGFAVHSLAHS